MKDISLTSQIKEDRGKVPTYIAELTAANQIKFWCPYCIKYHLHGAGKNNDAIEGHRVAHCTIECPNTKFGYYLITKERARRISCGRR